jgi:hypothetical protein
MTKYVALMISAILMTGCSPNILPSQREFRLNATTPSTAQRDRDIAREISEAWPLGSGGIWKAPATLAPKGTAIIPGLLWLIDNGEDNVGDSNLPEWLYAAYVLGSMKDEQYGNELVQRLDSPQAGSYWFVTSLGHLRVKKAVPYLIEWLHQERCWSDCNSAWGTDVHYLIPALNNITGRDFSVGVSPTDGDIGKYAKNKSQLLEAIDNWWSEKGRELYGPKPRVTDKKEER